MKSINVWMILMAVIMACSCATSQERAERRAQLQQAVEGGIAARQWHIDVKSMSSMRYGTRAVTPDFYLELRGDTLRSYLPYLGQVQQSPMGTQSIGLNFEKPILKYTEKRVKPAYSTMEIDVKTQEDSYHFHIDLYYSGEAQIRVRALNRDPISFDGHFTEQSTNTTTD